MANYRECKVCREAQERKHRHDTVWKVVAVISTILAIVFMILYFTSGEVVKDTRINNDVLITNEGGNATNENIGNITSDYEQRSSDTTAFIVVCVVFGVIVLGGICGYYLISQSRRKQQGAYREQEGRPDDGANRQ